MLKALDVSERGPVLGFKLLHFFRVRLDIDQGADREIPDPEVAVLPRRVLRYVPKPWRDNVSREEDRKPNNQRRQWWLMARVVELLESCGGCGGLRIAVGGYRRGGGEDGTWLCHHGWDVWLAGEEA